MLPFCRDSNHDENCGKEAVAETHQQIHCGRQHSSTDRVHVVSNLTDQIVNASQDNESINGKQTHRGSRPDAGTLPTTNHGLMRRIVILQRFRIVALGLDGCGTHARHNCRFDCIFIGCSMGAFHASGI